MSFFLYVVSSKLTIVWIVRVKRGQRPQCQLAPEIAADEASKLSLLELPMKVTAAMHTARMAPSITAYSAAVGPFSSARKRLIAFQTFLGFRIGSRS